MFMGKSSYLSVDTRYDSIPTMKSGRHLPIEGRCIINLSSNRELVCFQCKMLFKLVERHPSSLLSILP